MASRGDHFSRQSEGYARYRPTYPDALFAWIATHAPGRERAWDCATGAGQALHWFDIPAFAREARRVLKPGGAVVAWCYEIFTSTPDIDAVVDHLYRDIVGPYWPPERRFIEDGYRTLPFPFERIPTPALDLTATWTLDHLLGFLGTWSAVQRYRDDRGEDPLHVVRNDLADAWGDPDTARDIRWPLTILAGR